MVHITIIWFCEGAEVSLPRTYIHSGTRAMPPLPGTYRWTYGRVRGIPGPGARVETLLSVADEIVKP